MASLLRGFASRCRVMTASSIPHRREALACPPRRAEFLRRRPAEEPPSPEGPRGGGAVARPAKKGQNKGKATRKGELPEKVCATCGRPFTWRKKWADVSSPAHAQRPRPRAPRPRPGALSGRGPGQGPPPTHTRIRAPLPQVWDDVKYCSDRCRRERSTGKFPVT